ncbi:MAG: hypothetical protein AB1665_02030 [Candidatus Thermoplasmatota archaeon]
MSRVLDGIVWLRKRLSHASRQTWFLLTLIAIIAIAVRSVPAWTYAGWGYDLGIYYGLTNNFINTGQVFSNYTGWGDSYQYFPVLYFVTAVPHFLTGADPLWLMTKVAPIFGGLSVIFLFFIARNIGFGRRSSLLAALLLSVNAIHIYQTSHAAPLTMGHFFLLATLYFFTKERWSARDWVLLCASTMLLIGSHHLTTYMLLISLPFMISLSERKRYRRDLTYLAFAAGATFTYWEVVAITMPQFIQSATGLSWEYIIPRLVVPAYAGLVLVLLALRHPIGERFLRWLKEPVSIHTDWAKFLVSLGAMSAIILTLYFINHPAIILKPSPLLIVCALPMFALLSFAASGLWQVAAKKHGGLIIGWLVAILFSLGYALLAGSTILLPERHLEYLMIPLSLCASLGLVRLIYPLLKEQLIVRTASTERFTLRGARDYWRTYITLTAMEDRVALLNTPSRNAQKRVECEVLHEKRKINPKKLLPTLVIFVLIGSALSAYQALPEIGHREDISPEAFEAIDWLAHNATKNLSIATDHRLGTFLYAEGLNTTYERAWGIWNATRWQECWDALNSSDDHRVGYVLVDDVMREHGVDFVPILSVAKISNETYAMFQQQPFERIVSFESDDSGSWAEIYGVNWTYIDESLPSG